MSPRPHDGPAEEGLSSSLLEMVHDRDRVERLRNVLSGFCHRCRNSLNGIKLSLYLFRREARGAVPECWGEIETIYHQVEHLFDHLQAIYRPMTISRVRSPLEELIRLHEPRWRSWYESRGLALELDPPPEDICGEFDPAQLGAGLDAMAAWRANVGRAGVLTRVAWFVQDGCIEVQWREILPQEPPGPPDQAGAGARRCGDSTSRGVDVLALPLLARIVAAHGGHLECQREEGFRVVLRWPQYQRANHDGLA